MQLSQNLIKLMKSEMRSLFTTGFQGFHLRAWEKKINSGKVPCIQLVMKCYVNNLN